MYEVNHVISIQGDLLILFAVVFFAPVVFLHRTTPELSAQIERGDNFNCF